jgi:hypothetical protein
VNLESDWKLVGKFQGFFQGEKGLVSDFEFQMEIAES